MSSFAHRNRRRSQFRLSLESLEARVLLTPPLVVNPASFDPSRVLVQFQSPAARDQFHMPGFTRGEALPLVTDLYVANLGPGLGVSQALTALRASPLVRFAEPDYRVNLNVIPNDPSFVSEWGLHNSGQSGGLVDADMDAPEAWNVTTGTGLSIVAVLDSGIDYNHPDLASNIWTNPGEIAGNGIDDDGNGYLDDIRGWDFVNNDNNPMDDNSHGTHVAGTIGAVGNNGIGVAGVAWDVQLMALKFLDATGSGSTSNAIRALNYAVAKGATISNNSWGGTVYSTALYDAIASAGAQGHIFVAAAGNSAINNDSTPSYPASYNLANVVTVAATDRNDNLASFSNYGATSVDLAAPGVSIYSTLPGNTYGYKSGTSMATPHVAGALALVRELHPTWTYSQVINQITSTVNVLPSLSGKVLTGGRLNLANALGGGNSVLPVLSINSASATEGNSGTTNATFTVNLSAASTTSVTVNWATANGTATAVSDYTEASGTLTFAPGSTSQTVTVSINGDTLVESNETFLVNLSNAANATISTGQGTGTILNDDAAPLSLAINDVSINEGNGGSVNATFTVTLSAASTSTVTVNFATANDTAVSGSDYSAASGTLTFAPGSTSQTVTVPVTGDTLVEPNETFLVNLSNGANATIADGQGVGTITNDDTTISIGNVSLVEGNSGTKNAVFVVTLSQANATTVTVNFATADGTGKAGSDYVATSGTLSFAPGETSKTITVVVNGDVSNESDENFFVTISSPSNAALGTAQGQCLLTNDDYLLTIDNVSKNEGNSGSTAFVYTVTLNSPRYDAVVKVNWATASGTAKAPGDFVSSSGTLSFNPGETVKYVTVNVKGETTVENNETFVVRLSKPVNASVPAAGAAGNQGIGTILNDDGLAGATSASVTTPSDSKTSVVDSSVSSIGMVSQPIPARSALDGSYGLRNWRDRNNNGVIDSGEV